MIGPIAGIALWAFVVAFYLAGIDLGAASTVVLLGLGAVLIASAAIQTLKISASGLEITTREIKRASFSLRHMPQVDLIKLLCWIVIVATLALTIAYSVMPRAPFIMIYTSPGNGYQGSDPDHMTTKVGTLAIWGGCLSAASVVILAVKARRLRKSRSAAQGIKSGSV